MDEAGTKHGLSWKVAHALSRLVTYRHLPISQLATLAGVHPTTIGPVLRQLERAGWLGSFGNVGRHKGGKSPVCYFLTRKGHDGLQELSDEVLGSFVPVSVPVGWSPVMAHRVALTDVLIAMELGAGGRALRIVGMRIEYRRESRTAPDGKTYQFVETTDDFDGLRIKPDAGFVLERKDGKRKLLLLEVDRGTEPIEEREGSSILGKMKLYDKYLKSCKWEETYGKAQGYAILWVFPDGERVKNVRYAARYLDGPLHKRHLMTTYSQACTAFYEPVWNTRDALIVQKEVPIME